MPTRKRQWPRTDAHLLQRTLKERLAHVPTATELNGKHSIDKYVESIIDALQAGIDASTPWSNPSPRSMPGFDRECKNICREVQQLRRRWQRTRLEGDYEVYRSACNKKGRHIKRMLRDRRPALKSATNLGESNTSPPANGCVTQDKITRAAQDRSRERPLPPLPQFQFNRRGEPSFVQKMAGGAP